MDQIVESTIFAYVSYEYHEESNCVTYCKSTATEVL